MSKSASQRLRLTALAHSPEIPIAIHNPEGYLVAIAQGTLAANLPSGDYKVVFADKPPQLVKLLDHMTIREL